MHELVAHAYKFAEADEMRKHHSNKAPQIKPRKLKPRKQKPSRPSRPQQRERPSIWSKGPKQQQVCYKYYNYTPLTTSREQILNVISNESFMHRPNPLWHGLNTDKNKYCSYHKDIEHTIEQCTKLKDEIEYLIEKSHLKKYI